MQVPRTYAFTFVCQAGRLENQALLLAASLRRHLRCENELVAGIPSPADVWGTLAGDTIELLTHLKVKRMPITNEIDPKYPIGNKVSCLRLPLTPDRLIFIDTDILLTRDFQGDSLFAAPFAAKPVDLPNTLPALQWSRVYRACKTTRPAEVVASTLHQKLIPPYFNAGFISVDPALKLGDAWLDCCKRIDRMWGLPLKRPHLDQIALPVAARRLGLKYTALPDCYNYPVHLKPIDFDAPPLFAHYHDPATLRREPMLVSLVRELCEEHPLLRARLEKDPDYAPIFTRKGASVSVRNAGSGTKQATSFGVHQNGALPELIITGIPRSGTSYLCNLLHRYENCVVLNEPEGISRPLRKEPIPFGVATFYRDQRRNVLEGRPILNKLKNGKVTDETVGANEQTQYTPQVSGPDFVLGVKSPLAFLNRLDALRLAMPHARVIACVRNPYDTIASWKTSFEHLNSADVSTMRHGGLHDRFLSDRRRMALKEIARLRSPAWRRAAWWRYLAELILESGPGIIRVAYPVMATRPAPLVEQILDGFNAGDLREPIRPSTARSEKRSVLDEEDFQAIRALCGDAATALGVADDFAAELERPAVQAAVAQPATTSPQTPASLPERLPSKLTPQKASSPA